MHSNAWTEFHVIWRRRRSIVASRWYTTGSGRNPVDYPPGSVNDRSEAAGTVIDILTQNIEVARWDRPTRLT
jgi:hypothetical protein